MVAPTDWHRTSSIFDRCSVLLDLHLDQQKENASHFDSWRGARIRLLRFEQFLSFKSLTRTFSNEDMSDQNCFFRVRSSATKGNRKQKSIEQNVIYHSSLSDWETPPTSARPDSYKFPNKLYCGILEDEASSCLIINTESEVTVGRLIYSNMKRRRLVFFFETQHTVWNCSRCFFLADLKPSKIEKPNIKNIWRLTRGNESTSFRRNYRNIIINWKIEQRPENMKIRKYRTFSKYFRSGCRNQRFFDIKDRTDNHVSEMKVSERFRQHSKNK